MRTKRISKQSSMDMAERTAIAAIELNPNGPSTARRSDSSFLVRPIKLAPAEKKYGHGVFRRRHSSVRLATLFFDDGKFDEVKIIDDTYVIESNSNYKNKHEYNFSQLPSIVFISKKNSYVSYSVCDKNRKYLSKKIIKNSILEAASKAILPSNRLSVEIVRSKIESGTIEGASDDVFVTISGMGKGSSKNLDEPAMRIFQNLGIQNVIVTSHGPSNAVKQIQATFNAFSEKKSIKLECVIEKSI